LHAADRTPGIAAETSLVSLLVRVALVALAILPLVVGSIWIYGASAGAFRLQHQIRTAQNGRNDVMRLFLAMEDAVRGFAATSDPFFRRRLSPEPFGVYRARADLRRQS